MATCPLTEGRCADYAALVTRLLFRIPGRVEPIGAWLASLMPGVERAHRRRLIAEGRVLQDGVVIDRPGFVCAPGARIEIDAQDDALLPPADSASGSDWLALVDRPPWPSGAVAWGEAGKGGEGETLVFRRLESPPAPDGLAWLALSGEVCGAEDVLSALAGSSMPVAGDLRRGGLGLAGGPWLRSATSAAQVGGPAGPAEASKGAERVDRLQEAAWREEARPEEPCALEASPVDAPILWVSRETARALGSGHPWILPDAASDPATRFRPGALVRLAERGGGRLGWAHIEGTDRLAARVWSLGEGEGRSVDSVEARVARAIARRRTLLVGDPTVRTNAIRLIHGEGDGLPGLFVDRLGPLLRVLVSGWATEGFRERAIAALRNQLPVSPEGEPWSVLELLHLRSPGASQVDRVRWIEGGREAIEAAGFPCTETGFAVEERGLVYEVDPGWDEPRRPRPGYGLFIDQRDNRERLTAGMRAAGPGGAWLNLFAHTGAFSVALLAAGAERVVSVDLSPAYLDRLERNLEANRTRGVEPDRHETRRGDVRRYLEELDPAQRFRGIIVDPPTAAAAGRRFWSVKQDLEPLLERVIDRLVPGGTLLVTQNRAGPPIGLDRVLERCASRCQRAVERLEPAPAGEDHPVLPGFPEGDPFEGWRVDLR